MKATLTLPINDYAAKIIEAAGADPDTSYLDGKVLHLKGVNQSTADAALSSFDVTAWNKDQANRPHKIALAATDAQMGRVIEDIIVILDGSGYNIRGQLSDEAQDLVTLRETTRGKMV